MIKTEWADITPMMASEYLSRASINRPARKSRIEAYARDMAAGKWLETGESIKFTPAGEMIDGQHRLNAIIVSGKTVRMLIVRGVEPNSIDVIDSGAGRSFADLLAIRGESAGVASTLAALTRRIYLWDQGQKLQIGVSQTITHKELDEFLVAHPELRDQAKYCTGRVAHPANVAPSLFAAFRTLTTRVDGDKSSWFCQRWIDGINLPGEHPVLVLRERISTDRLADSPIGQHWTNELKLALGFMAWNAFREGRSLQKLQLPRGGLTNSKYPEPK